MPEPAEVVVVGAGLAGLACARRLAASGVVATGGRRHLLTDPRRTPLARLPQAFAGALRTVRSVAEVAALARWALHAVRAHPADLLAAPDEPWGEALDSRGITGELRREVLEPFLAGVIGERDGSTSRRYLELLVRSFARGRPSVPWEGLQAVPDQLARMLPAGA